MRSLPFLLLLFIYVTYLSNISNDDLDDDARVVSSSFFPSSDKSKSASVAKYSLGFASHQMALKHLKGLLERE